MDDYAIYLAEEACSDVAALHQFRILYEPEDQSFHFFFEGDEDSLFFTPAARRYTKEIPLHLYECGGKKNVIEVRDEIKAGGYDLKKCLFFVDRDYDDFLGCQVSMDEHTYMTDGYSIENEVSNLTTAKIVMAEILGISQANPDFRLIENNLTKVQNSLYKELRPLMAWILASRSMGYGPNLNNTLGLKGILEVNDNAIFLTKKGFVNFKKKVVVANRLPKTADILFWRRKLDISHAKKWVRGKYEIWVFYTAFLSMLQKLNSARKNSDLPLIRIPSALKEFRIFEIVGGRILPPASLQKFFDTKLLKG